MVKIRKKRGNLEKIILIPLIASNILACDSAYPDDKKLEQESKSYDYNPTHYSLSLNKEIKYILDDYRANKDNKENPQKDLEYKYFIIDINGENKREITLTEYEKLRRDALEARAQEKEQQIPTECSTEYSE